MRLTKEFQTFLGKIFKRFLPNLFCFLTFTVIKKFCEFCLVNVYPFRKDVGLKFEFCQIQGSSFGLFGTETFPEEKKLKQIVSIIDFLCCEFAENADV